jgi:hypothetical protein
MARKNLFLSLILIACLFIVSCKPNTAGITPVISQELQNSVPFKIVIPSYLPDDIKNHIPLIQGPWTDTPAPDITTIHITYQKGGEPVKMIIIDEENSFIEQDLGPEGTSFIVNGTTIGEGPSQMGGSQILNGLIFAWNTSDIHYAVQIYGYQDAESRKIICSMIN